MEKAGLKPESKKINTDLITHMSRWKVREDKKEFKIEGAGRTKEWDLTLMVQGELRRI